MVLCTASRLISELSGDSLAAIAAHMSLNNRPKDALLRARQALEFRERVLPAGHPNIAAMQQLITFLQKFSC